MLAVVKKPHTNMMLFEIKGDIPSQVLAYLQQQFGANLNLVEDKEETVNIFDTAWYKQISSALTPGDAMKVYRENQGLTILELAEKLGNLTSEEIAEMESNKREINIALAEKLSELFNVPVERFLCH
jgi:DNA-binding XRE family transcriptional regulator